MIPHMAGVKHWQQRQFAVGSSSSSTGE